MMHNHHHHPSFEELSGGFHHQQSHSNDYVLHYPAVVSRRRSNDDSPTDNHRTVDNSRHDDPKDYLKDHHHHHHHPSVMNNNNNQDSSSSVVFAPERPGSAPPTFSLNSTNLFAFDPSTCVDFFTHASPVPAAPAAPSTLNEEGPLEGGLNHPPKKNISGSPTSALTLALSDQLNLNQSLDRHPNASGGSTSQEGLAEKENQDPVIGISPTLEDSTSSSLDHHLNHHHHQSTTDSTNMFTIPEHELRQRQHHVGVMRRVNHQQTSAEEGTAPNPNHNNLTPASAIPTRRKNSIEMFLSQSPSQALGGDLMKLNVKGRGESGSGARSKHLESTVYPNNPNPTPTPSESTTVEEQHGIQRASSPPPWDHSHFPSSSAKSPNASDFHPHSAHPHPSPSTSPSFGIRSPSSSFPSVTNEKRGSLNYNHVRLSNPSHSNNNQHHHHNHYQSHPIPQGPTPTHPTTTTKLCKFYAQGHCRMGNKCKFTHETTTTTTSAGMMSKSSPTWSPASLSHTEWTPAEAIATTTATPIATGGSSSYVHSANANFHNGSPPTSNACPPCTSPNNHLHHLLYQSNSCTKNNNNHHPLNSHFPTLGQSSPTNSSTKSLAKKSSSTFQPTPQPTSSSSSPTLTLQIPKASTSFEEWTSPPARSNNNNNPNHHEEEIETTTCSDTTLDPILHPQDIQGRVFSMSKDQNGCRLLQEQLSSTSGSSEMAALIFHEALDHLADMMVDPFGNYLFQKLLEGVTEHERTLIIRRVAGNLVPAALNLHGTRSVQKVRRLLLLLLSVFLSGHDI